MKKIMILLLGLMVQDVYSQTFSERYDFKFDNLNEYSWEWKTLARCSDITRFSITLKDVNKPVQVIKVSDFLPKNPSFDMMSILSRVIILPKYEKDAICTVKLSAKSETDISPYFVVSSFDADENCIFIDSVAINNKNWRESKISFTLCDEKALKVNINYFGNKEKNQSYLLDGINISINSKDIGYMDVFSVDKKRKINLDKKQIQPLSIKNDKTILPIVESLKGKKIIGLGECLHGSQSIVEGVFQFMRSFIEHGNTRVILFEGSVTNLLRWNLYTLGYKPKEYRKEIMEDLMYLYTNQETLASFLDWLREYNARTENKVYVMGVDGIDFPDLFFSLLHIDIQGKEKAISYIDLYREKKYEEIINTAGSDKEFQYLLGKDLFNLYISILKEHIKRKSSEKTISMFYNQENREENMAVLTRLIVDSLVGENENALLYMHSGHINRKDFLEISPVKIYPTGYHLSKAYGEDYYGISFQVGTGGYLQDERSVFSPKIVDTLLPCLPQSFEYAALNAKTKYFFYPIKYLNSDIMLMNKIARESRLSGENDVFLSPKEHFDAFVFIKESAPLSSFNNKGYFATDYYDKKAKSLNLPLFPGIIFE